MTQVSDKSGIVLIDKPEGMTSFSVVSAVRKILGIKKAGHAGTLDPFATGLLVVALGRATRVLRYMENHDKTYRATMELGIITDTGDKEGKIVGGTLPDEKERARLLDNNASLIRDAVMSMKGEITQVPSIYSAIKISGRPAYDYARSGQEVEIPSRKVTIHSIEIHEIYEKDGKIRVDMTVSCSKGTYIRSLCEDIGKKLGCGAYCLSLRRLKAGAFSVENALSLEKLREKTEGAEDGGNMGFLLPEMCALSDLSKISVSEKEARDLRNGKKLDFSVFKDRMENIGATMEQRVLAVAGTEPVAVIYSQKDEETILIREERVFS